MEEVDWVDAFAANFRVEVRTAGMQSALLHQHQHDLSRQVDVGWELVGIPAQEQVARIGVDASENSLDRRILQFVHHRVTSESRMVCFDVQLNNIHQAVLAQEVETGCGVEVVLMLGRFLWLWLKQELAFEAD